MRRTLFIATALITFLLGTILVSVRHSSLEDVNETQQIEIAIWPPDAQEFSAPVKIGVFIGVDGVTLSADGKKFVLYEPYQDRETVVPMSPDELTELANQLRSAGLFEEAQSNAPAFVSLPQNYTIVLAWPDKIRQFNWISGYGCTVPEQYLLILEKLNRNVKHPLLKEFIAHNRPHFDQKQRCV